MSTNAATNPAPGPHGDGGTDGDRGTDGGTPDHVENAGAFDIRNFIAALLGLYGVVLALWGLVSHSAADAAKTGGVNANLWTGLGLVVVAALFFGWAKAAPLRVEVHEGADGEKELDAVD